jgi:hypothetical protein
MKNKSQGAPSVAAKQQAGSKGRPAGSGRRKLYDERLLVPLVAGTVARLDAVKTETEDRLDVIRVAVSRELARREK